MIREAKFHLERKLCSFRFSILKTDYEDRVRTGYVLFARWTQFSRVILPMFFRRKLLGWTSVLAKPTFQKKQHPSPFYSVNWLNWLLSFERKQENQALSKGCCHLFLLIRICDSELLFCELSNHAADYNPIKRSRNMPRQYWWERCQSCHIFKTRILQYRRITSHCFSAF